MKKHRELKCISKVQLLLGKIDKRKSKMAKVTSKSNDFLFNVKKTTSAKIYSVLLELVNKDREDLAKLVKKVDYLMEYTSTCIKQKDFKEARETIKNVEERLKSLEEENVDTEYLRYLYDGIKKKIK
ncbi:hypothetical protein [uncultured Clostridium sp.]|uniref:hypothetical protein n=1 Tax=uncultured Clostridium sp. TaxID=59620 RepID=UPI003456EAD4